MLTERRAEREAVLCPYIELEIIGAISKKFQFPSRSKMQNTAEFLIFGPSNEILTVPLATATRRLSNRIYIYYHSG